MPVLATADAPPGSAKEVRPLLVGAEVPKAMLKTVEDANFDLYSNVLDKRTILIFYRGGW